MEQTHNSLFAQDLGRSFEPIHLERESLPGLTKEVADYVKPVWDFQYVRTLKQLEALVKKLNNAPLFSLDTETSGTESTEAQTGRRIMSDLSLHLEIAQVGIPKVTKTKEGFSIPDIDPTQIEGQTYLVDVRALKAEAAKKSRQTGQEVNPMSAFREPFENPNITKAIQHRAFEDGQFNDKYQVPINGVMDTEKLAKLFRPGTVDSNPLGPLMVSYSLGALSLEILNRHLDKDSQKGPWNLRTAKGYLPEKLEDYARLDAEETIYVLMALLQYSAYVDKEIARLGAENDSQGLLREYRLALLEREQLYEDAKIADAAFFLEAAAQAYEANLKSVVLPLLHAESSKAAEEKGEDPKSAKVEHRTVYGSAYLRCAAVYKLNWDKLAEIDPALVSEVKPEPTFTKTSLEQAISRLKLEETHSAKAIWEELKEETGKRSEATLKIKLKEPVKERSVKPFLKQIAIPENWGIDEHLQAIIEARVNKLKLLREAGVANQLGMIEMKISGLQELMLQKLREEGLKDAQGKQQLLPGQEAKAPSSWKSSGETGEVSYSSRALDTRDVNKLIEKYPDIAELAVDRNRQPSKTAVQEALRSRGYEPAQAESMAESLFEVVGYGKAETWIYPKYGLYYKGPDEEFLDDSGQLK